MKIEKILNIKLTEYQRKYFRGIKWLLDADSNLGYGRTFLMAIIYIDLALKYPNKWIYVSDHHSSLIKNNWCFKAILELISRTPNLFNLCEFNTTTKSFKIKEIIK